MYRLNKEESKFSSLVKYRNLYKKNICFSISNYKIGKKYMLTFVKFMQLKIQIINISRIYKILY